jgi:hypothetical protein
MTKPLPKDGGKIASQDHHCVFPAKIGPCPIVKEVSNEEEKEEQTP